MSLIINVNNQVIKMAHKLNSQDQWFLSLRRRDPLQKSEFELGNQVVVCTKCKCVQTYDSWAFNGNKCVECGHNRSTDDFSREYIDFSYHRDSKSSKTIRGFKVVESDIKYQVDKIRKWFSQQRVSRTNQAYLWFYIVILILLIGLIYYWGHGSVINHVSTAIIPLCNNALTKIQYSPLRKLSDLGISSKFRHLNFDTEELLAKFVFLQNKIILLGTSFLLIGRKVVDSFIQIEWKEKETTITTNFHTLIDYITHIFKR